MAYTLAHRSRLTSQALTPTYLGAIFSLRNLLTLTSAPFVNMGGYYKNADITDGRSVDIELADVSIDIADNVRIIA